jgi:hypothetical protein
VLAPGVENVISFFLYESLQLGHLNLRQPVILGKFNTQFQLELRLSVGAVNVNVRPPLFTREKEEPVAFPFEYRRTHATNSTRKIGGFQSSADEITPAAN